MKLNGAPRNYMPLPQNQSDDDETGSNKDDNLDKICIKNSVVRDASLDNKTEPKNISVKKEKLPQMSLLRMVAFFLSLIFCVLFIVIFLLFLPCRIPVDLLRKDFLAEKWVTKLHNLTFSTSISVVGFNILKDPILVFGYRSLDNESNEAGLLALQANHGEQVWRLPLHLMPMQCFCDWIDVNNDGVLDCIVIGQEGLMTAVDTVKGVNLWYLHSHEHMYVADSVAFLAILPDCDNDTVPDLIVSYVAKKKENSAYLAFVSGHNGKIIGSIILVPYCASPISHLFSWTWENQTDLFFLCMDKNETGILWLLPFKNICDYAHGRYSHLKMKRIYKFSQSVSALELKTFLFGNKLVLVSRNVVTSLERLKLGTFKPMWEINLKDNWEIKAVTEGLFIEADDPQIVIVRFNGYDSEIIGHNIIDGSEIWSIKQENGTVTSVTTLPKLFGNTDGLILKVVFPEREYHSNIQSEQVLEGNILNKSFSGFNYSHGKQKFGTLYDIGSLESFEENYVLVKYGEMSGVTLSNQQIYSICNGNYCWPDAYTSKATAMINKAEKLAALNMLVLSSSIVFSNSSENHMEVETTVKYFCLGELLAFPSCASR